MAKLALPGMNMNIMARAVQAFDKATMVIISVVWGAALLLLIMAWMGLGRVSSARAELAAAEASMPQTPIIDFNKVPVAETEKIVEKLNKRYGAILNIAPGRNKEGVVIRAEDPSAFSTWLTAVTYLDILRPDMTWTIEDMCVGPKCKEAVMQGTFTAKISKFSIPASSAP